MILRAVLLATFISGMFLNYQVKAAEQRTETNVATNNEFKIGAEYLVDGKVVFSITQDGHLQENIENLRSVFGDRNLNQELINKISDIRAGKKVDSTIYTTDDERDQAVARCVLDCFLKIDEINIYNEIVLTNIEGRLNILEYINQGLKQYSAQMRTPIINVFGGFTTLKNILSTWKPNAFTYMGDEVKGLETLGKYVCGKWTNDARSANKTTEVRFRVNGLKDGSSFWADNVLQESIRNEKITPIIELNNARTVLSSDFGRANTLAITGDTVVVKADTRGNPLDSKELRETHGGPVSYIQAPEYLKHIIYRPNTQSFNKTYSDNSTKQEEKTAEQISQQNTGWLSWGTNLISQGVSAVSNYTKELVKSYTAGTYDGYAALAIEYPTSRSESLNSIELDDKVSALYIVNKDVYDAIVKQSEAGQNKTIDFENNPLKGILRQEKIEELSKRKVPVNNAIARANSVAYQVKAGNDSFLWIVPNRDEIFKSKKDATAQRIAVYYDEEARKVKALVP